MAPKIKTAAELAKRVIDVAENYKTLYVMGCFGAPMTSANKRRYCDNNSYNRQASRTAMIQDASADTFGFDCVCLIKGLLWGWSGDASKNYGGASYKTNGVPDITADAMFNACKDKSSDFSNIEIGEAVWMDGHIGVYVGDGLAVECTPSWDNCVQLTACNRSKSGYHRRDWTKHGKLPYVKYTGTSASTAPAQGTSTGTSKPASKPASTDTSAAKDLPFAVGDIVTFTGSRHYSNPSAANGPACRPGKAKVTNTRKGAKHPYHLVKVSGGGSTVHGWVNAADVQENGAIATGDVVQFSGGPHYNSANAKTGSGNPKAGPAKVTAIRKGAKHPYHIVHTDKQSSVYGWVDADKIKK